MEVFLCDTQGIVVQNLAIPNETQNKYATVMWIDGYRLILLLCNVTLIPIMSHSLETLLSNTCNTEHSMSRQVFGLLMQVAVFVNRPACHDFPNYLSLNRMFHSEIDLRLVPVTCRLSSGLHFMCINSSLERAEVQ